MRGGPIFTKKSIFDEYLYFKIYEDLVLVFNQSFLEKNRAPPHSENHR